MARIRIEHPSLNLDYDTFIRLNDICFADEPVSENQLQSFLGTGFWTMFDGDTLIGFSLMTTREDRAHIRRIAIHPDYRAQGLGTRLMDCMLDEATVHGLSQVDLSVQQDNLPAIQLYEKFGFLITGISVQFLVNIHPSDIQDFSAVPIPEYLARENRDTLEKWVDQWANRHKPPHQWVLVFLRRGLPIGFTSFHPEFPGCTPFELIADSEVGDIRALISLLSDYALPHQQTLKITTSNTKAISLFEACGSAVNYRLYEMARQL